MIGWTIPVFSQLQFMAIAVNIKDGVAQVAKYVGNYSKRSNAVLAIGIAAKGVLHAVHY